MRTAADPNPALPVRPSSYHHASPLQAGVLARLSPSGNKLMDSLLFHTSEPLHGLCLAEPFLNQHVKAVREDMISPGLILPLHQIDFYLVLAKRDGPTSP